MILTPTPEFHREIGFPRTVALEYPYGRPLGETGDTAGQRRILLIALDMLNDAKKPGQIDHLPMKWHEDPKNTKWHPPEISPIVKLFLGEIKEQGKARKK